ncbi:hypothetical protein [Nonomuraea roseoviolacea]|uniref:Uncharacterized protein n=1 Tax=Nonomuraea roseoviolacea subsp. carminata TaxID=160689 RepID=A0ABT1JZS3_9ACTN|nr:hypothetical protein [Nonomuraea roseoviolacea]MCP2347095.1 hypothetical protein [Nonomuraea roseoviolacea subsp. carminata]
MRIRLDGTRAELIDALIRLRLNFTVSGVSRAYSDRAKPRHWRIYVTTHPRKRT